MGSYKSCQDRAGSGGSCSSTDTAASDRSKSTAPTLMSERAMSGPKYQKWPEFEYLDEIPISVSVEEEDEEYEDYDDEHDPHHSVSTYASTTRSKADIAPEEPVFEVDDREESFPSDALASTPSSFADLFPSTRRLLIRHDDVTIDGNMNLRVDTVVPCRDGYQQDVILFHLRMYDLFSRKCSFRRYCRDSGREVCHSIRKEVNPPNDRRPVFRRSWSSMLASFRPSSSGSNSHPGHAPVVDHLKRQDSGYGPGRNTTCTLWPMTPPTLTHLQPQRKPSPIQSSSNSPTTPTSNSSAAAAPELSATSTSTGVPGTSGAVSVGARGICEKSPIILWICARQRPLRTWFRIC